MIYINYKHNDFQYNKIVPVWYSMINNHLCEWNHAVAWCPHVQRPAYNQFVSENIALCVTKY